MFHSGLVIVYCSPVEGYSTSSGLLQFGISYRYCSAWRDISIGTLYQGSLQLLAYLEHSFPVPLLSLKFGQVLT